MRDIECEILDVLRFFGPISCREIADMLSLPRGKVYYRLNDVLKEQVYRFVVDNEVLYELY